MEYTMRRILRRTETVLAAVDAEDVPALAQVEVPIIGFLIRQSAGYTVLAQEVVPAHAGGQEVFKGVVVVDDDDVVNYQDLATV